MVFIMIVIALFGDIYDEIPLTVNPDPNYVPDTYEEWLDSQPDYEPISVRIIGGTDGADVIMIFEEGLTDSLDAGLLNQWIADLASQGLTAEVIEVPYTSPEDIKDYLKFHYNNNDLQGVIFIGNLPVAWCMMDNDFLRYGESFPVDYFYMDLDGTWEDLWIGYPSEGVPGTDGKYDTISGSLDSEIYVGRIKVDNLSALGDPVDLLNDYLQRNHEWRTNNDPVLPVALCYVDDDWASWGNGWAADMGKLYSNIVLVNQPSETNGTDYLENRLPYTYVWISPFVHSGPGTHYWQPGPTTTWNELVPANPFAHFYNLFACSNARFTEPHCMGSVYTLCTATGLASVGSTKSGSMLSFSPFYSPMGNGASIGEAYADWWDYIAQGGLSPSERSWHLGMVLLGDPTLMPSMHMVGVEEQNIVPDAISGLTITGNPCYSEVVISYPAEHGSVELYDTSGRLVAAGLIEDTSCDLDVSSLRTGFYIVRVRVEGESATASVVILK